MSRPTCSVSPPGQTCGPGPSGSPPSHQTSSQLQRLPLPQLVWWCGPRFLPGPPGTTAPGHHLTPRPPRPQNPAPGPARCDQAFIRALHLRELLETLLPAPLSQGGGGALPSEEAAFLRARQEGQEQLRRLKEKNARYKELLGQTAPPAPAEAAEQPGARQRKHVMVTRSMLGSSAAAAAGPQQAPGGSRTPAVPRPPLLRTALRHRHRQQSQAPVLPSEQQELERLASLPPFKARPLDPRVLEGEQPPAGAPSTARKRPLTQPVPFHLRTDQRALTRLQQQQEEEEEGAGPPPSKRRSVGPAPPHPSLVDSLACIPERQSLGTMHQKAARVPRAATPALPARPALTPATAGRKRGREDSEVTPATGRPNKRVSVGPAPPTQPRPFRLVTDARHERHESEWRARLESEEQDARRQRWEQAACSPSLLQLADAPPPPLVRPLPAQPAGSSALGPPAPLGSFRLPQRPLARLPPGPWIHC